VIVVTDTSVVLNLAWLREERLLAELFGTVLAPSAVRAEFEHLAPEDDRFRDLRFPAFVRIADPTHIPDALALNVDRRWRNSAPWFRGFWRCSIDFRIEPASA